MTLPTYTYKMLEEEARIVGFKNVQEMIRYIIAEQQDINKYSFLLKVGGLGIILLYYKVQRAEKFEKRKYKKKSTFLDPWFIGGFSSGFVTSYLVEKIVENVGGMYAQVPYEQILTGSSWVLGYAFGVWLLVKTVRKVKELTLDKFCKDIITDDIKAVEVAFS